MSMRKLERFLLKNCNIYQESASTYSKYFKIEECMIRLSDHFNTNDGCDISIIIPLNKTNKYIISAKESSTVYLWNTNEIIEFIPHLVKFCNLRAKSIKKPEVKIKKIVSSLVSKKDLPKELGNIIRHPKNQLWTKNDIQYILILINQELNINLTQLASEFENFILTHYLSYSKLLNLYKAIYIDNNITNINSELLINTLNLL